MSNLKSGLFQNIIIYVIINFLTRHYRILESCSVSEGPGALAPVPEAEHAGARPDVDGAQEVGAERDAPGEAGREEAGGKGPSPPWSGKSFFLSCQLLQVLLTSYELTYMYILLIVCSDLLS